MEDRWKIRTLGSRLHDLAERAEYDTLVKRYREEEQRANLNNLLYGAACLPPRGKSTKK